MPYSRNCAHCGQQVRSSGGLERHLQRCKVFRDEEPRQVPRIPSTSFNVAASPPPNNAPFKLGRHAANEGLPGPRVRDQQEPGNVGLETSATYGPLASMQYDPPNGPHGLQFDSDGVGAVNESANRSEGDTGSADGNREVDQSTVLQTGRSVVSTTFSLHEVTYHELHGSHAGAPRGEPVVLQTPLLPTPSYDPFRDARDYAIAYWLHKSKLTKGKVDDYLRDPRIEANLSFKNGKEWLHLLDEIPWGLGEREWYTHPIEIGSELPGVGGRTYHIYYRDVILALRFLLGHRPFDQYLTYAPVRHFNNVGYRVYSEMHTAEWWWETQTALPEGATVVPVMISTDKTSLTKHQGDLSAWPVYLTIGNLSREVRRSQSRPGMLLLGLLPVVKTDTIREKDIKATVWHTALSEILKPLEQAAQEGINVFCADLLSRRCYPIIAAFMSDYEEQVLVTGVKMNRHCVICTAPPEMRENLDKQWPKRSHASTKSQLVLQGAAHRTEADSSWVHDISNFAWSHHHVNIHEIMMVDILHQLLKGTVGHMLEWLGELIDQTTTSTKNNRKTRSLQSASGKLQLDERFRAVPAFTGLKRFDHYSQLKQWTAADRQSVIRQIVPVIAPLLTEQAPAAVLFTRAMVDFVLLAQYHSHDEETLRYLSHALYRIDRLKGAFRSFRPVDPNTGEGHFNIPKFHAMIHYHEFIQKYGVADNFNTEHTEAAHKHLVKDFFDRTNKRETWQAQLMHHNTRHVNLRAMEDVLLHDSTRKSALQPNEKLTVITSASRAMGLTKLIRDVDVDEHSKAARAGLDPKVWVSALKIAQCIDLPYFLDALAVFVRESRREYDRIDHSDRGLYRVEEDPSWVGSMHICLHESLRCWKREELTPSNPEGLVPERVRCSPSWQGKDGIWRRDHVLLQHRQVVPNSQAGTLDGRLPGRLLVVLSVSDPTRRDQKNKPIAYQGALVDILQARNGGRPHRIHGMIEVQTQSIGMSSRPYSLGPRKFVKLTAILRSLHVVSSRGDQTQGKQSSEKLYLNNYSDWDIYNTLYDEDFLDIGTKLANRYGRGA